MSHVGKLKNAFDHYHNSDHPAFREKKTKSFYPFGRKSGAENIVPTDAYRDNYDRIFRKSKKKGVDDTNGEEEEKEPASQG